ncbi:DUF2649 family protein [Spiroplasma endosymbiont of Polydrusus pterygomalis]|uniref:DUF2649 family protein n=1 Tax=Spiroplasma endosymbiont of Polydrusus pterygomalis TaxID=3139327 RepID=UPI003CCB2CA1
MINQHWEQLQKLFVNIFLFINQTQIEKFLARSLTQTNYFVCMIGVWIVILFLTWFVLWMTFKFLRMF